ncbi:hypothetical protein LOAG_00371 [Loa loa]|uniref:Uncharacterized protein n=1 Tax=Loa loa TaxID=7209 RepID=A0A1S0UDG8_LOALO|nr:hypothetical protein LOAG_00371 [Loa loa]EFO28112.1 hypothetical protein LOAG_00371 [Loa loa]
MRAKLRLMRNKTDLYQLTNDLDVRLCGVMNILLNTITYLLSFTVIEIHAQWNTATTTLYNSQTNTSVGLFENIPYFDYFNLSALTLYNYNNSASFNQTQHLLCLTFNTLRPEVAIGSIHTIIYLNKYSFRIICRFERQREFFLCDTFSMKHTR